MSYFKGEISKILGRVRLHNRPDFIRRMHIQVLSKYGANSIEGVPDQHRRDVIESVKKLKRS